eukprot:m.235186 g.235186  ORF g.235186 m.235186 type:complete len:972 (+) comp17400_c0_seq4:1-2916(+)
MYLVGGRVTRLVLQQFAEAWTLTLTGSTCVHGAWRKLPDLPAGPFSDGTATLFYQTQTARPDVLVHGGYQQLRSPVTESYRLDTAVNTWTQVKLPSYVPRPQLRAAHGSVWLPRTQVVLMVQGGLFGSDLLSYAQEAWTLSPDRGLWNNLRQTNYPDRRLHPAMARLGTSQRLAMFGGRFGTQFVNGHTWVFDAQDELWERLEVNESPPGRDSATFEGYSTGALLFGGRVQALTTTSDLWMLSSDDSRRGNWTQLQETDSSIGPSRRNGHSSVVVAHVDGRNTESMYVFGGYKSLRSAVLAVFYDDFWRFTFPSGQPELGGWHAVSTSTGPKARAGHCAVVLRNPDGSDDLLVFGGAVVASRGVIAENTSKQATSAALTDELWAFNFHNRTWRRVGVGADRERPPALVYPQCVALDGTRMVVTSGLTSMVGREMEDINNKLHVGRWLDGVWVWWDLDLPSSSLGLWGGAMVRHPGTASTLVYQAGMNAYMLNGRDTESTLSVLHLDCPLGYELLNGSDFATGVCYECKVGFYLNDSRIDSCHRCSAGTTTATTGARSGKECKICDPHYCHHGTCSVVLDDDLLLASCDCHFGYTGHRCTYNSLGASVGVAVAVFFVLGVAAWMAYKVRLNVRSLKYDVLLHENLLSETNMQLERLEQVWQIKSDEVTLLSKIDSGGQGEVWLGEWQDREVAVKRMHQHLLELDEVAVQEFEQEVAIMRSIRHNNIVFFFGWGIMHQVPFLVAEYMRLGSVKNLLSKHHDWPWAFKLKMCLDTSRGLAYLHSQNHIHRDIKSANLLVGQSWVVKIGDFGTSRLCSLVSHSKTNSTSDAAATSRHSMSSAGMTRGVGTVFWSAPEILETRPYNTPADIFSLGIVMVEMVVDRRYPYDDDIAALPIWDFRAAIANGVRPTLPETTTCPDGFIGLMIQCQKGDSHTRPTAEQVVMALEHLLETTTIPSNQELNEILRQIERKSMQ